MLFYWNGYIFINFNFQESGTPTLQGLSFTVRPGELLAVIGPVGTGKVNYDAFWQLDAMLQALLNSHSGAQSWVCLSLSWVYLKQCFSRCVPWNISFARRFRGWILQDKCTLCFPSLCFTLLSWESIVRNLDASVKETIYVAAVWDGRRQCSLLFVTGAPPGSLEVVKTFPGSFEHFLMWLDLILSVHV